MWTLCRWNGIGGRDRYIGIVGVSVYAVEYKSIMYTTGQTGSSPQTRHHSYLPLSPQLAHQCLSYKYARLTSTAESLHSLSTLSLFSTQRPCMPISHYLSHTLSRHQLLGNTPNTYSFHGLLHTLQPCTSPLNVSRISLASQTIGFTTSPSWQNTVVHINKPGHSTHLPMCAQNSFPR